MLDYAESSSLNDPSSAYNLLKFKMENLELYYLISFYSCLNVIAWFSLEPGNLKFAYSTAGLKLKRDDGAKNGESFQILYKSIINPENRRTKPSKKEGRGGGGEGISGILDSTKLTWTYM